IDEGPRTIGFKLAASSGRLMARYGKTPLATHQWYHVAGVYDAEARSLELYLNGRSDNGCLRGHVTTRQHASGFGVFVGRRAGDPGFEFAGAGDDVRITSRAPAQAEIESMMEGIVSPVITVTSDLKNNPNASDGPCRSEERTVLTNLRNFGRPRYARGVRLRWSLADFDLSPGGDYSQLVGRVCCDSLDSTHRPSAFSLGGPYPHSWWRAIGGTVIARVTSGRSQLPPASSASSGHCTCGRRRAA